MCNLDCKDIETAIRRAKSMLINNAKTDGIVENFGQDVCKAIRDRFIDPCDYSDKMNDIRKQIEVFENWCANYSM